MRGAIPGATMKSILSRTFGIALGSLLYDLLVHGLHSLQWGKAAFLLLFSGLVLGWLERRRTPGSEPGGRTATAGRTAPPGHFRLTGCDSYDYSDYPIGDYLSLGLAIQEAKARAATPNGNPTSFSDHFYVYDEVGECRYKVTHDDLTPQERAQILAHHEPPA